jgi:hypothetical protein
VKGDAEYEEMEQLETSRAERILAVGMVVFMLIGGAWVLNRISSLVPYPDRTALEVGHGLVSLRDSVQVSQARFSEAQRIYADRAERATKAQAVYEFRREEYRVSMEQGAAADSTRAAYEASRTEYEAAVRERDIAARVKDAAAEDLSRVEGECREKEGLVAAAFERALRLRETKLFLLRAAYVIPALLLCFALWHRMRRAGSRYLIVGTALLAFSIIQVTIVAAQYSWHFLRGLGQLALSVVGTAACAFGLVAIRRLILSSARLARSRFRRGQCPNCGFPRASGAYCMSCGTKLTEQCPNCAAQRPVNAPYCPSCGSSG